MKRLELALALLAAVAAIVVTGAAAADFESDSGPCTETPGEAALLRCTTAHVGEKYEVEIQSEDGSGCEPYDWFEIKNGSLPAGLSMNRDGVISGVPTGGPGLARFWVWNHDLTADQGGPSWCQVEDRSEREFSIPVDPGLAIDNESLDPATIGQAYSETFTATQVQSLNPLTGPSAQATWSVESGALPPGVTLSASGAMAGTPTTEGSYQFVVKAQNGGISDTETYTLGVRQPVTVKPSFASVPSPSAEVGIRLGKTFTATGGSGAYTWSLASGALPVGVALDTAKGTISGIPRAAGGFPFAVTATDSDGRAATAGVALKVAARLTIETPPLRPAKLGRPYQSKLRTAGGVSPLRWKANGKLPGGVHFAKSLGALVGTPRRAGTFRVLVEARDALGARAHRSLVLVVKP